MKNKKSLIISAVLIAAINIIVIAGWWFIFSGVRKERGAVLDVRREIDTSGQRLNNSHSLKILLAGVEKDREKITAAFLNSENIVKFVEELEFLGRKASTTLDVKAIELPAQSGKKEPYFNFKITGTFREIFQYLVLLENLPYQISFEKVQLIRPQPEEREIKPLKAPGIPIWEADLEIKLLSYED